MANEELEGLDPEIAALMGGPPEALDLSAEVAQEIPTRKQLEEIKKEADQIPTAADHDTTLQRKIGKFWANMVPGASVARCYYRPHKGPGAGSSNLIGEYTIRDIQASGGDLQAFVLNNLVPTYGGGVYRFYVTDPKTHREIYVGFVPVADKPPQEAQDVSLSQTLIAHFLKDLADQKKTIMSQPPPPDPFDQLKKAQEAMALLSGGNGSKSDPMAMMMFLMMQQMNAPRPEPKADPMLVALIERMDRRMEAMEKRVSEERSAAPPPPPPPPPPPQGPDVVEVISKLAPLLKPERPEISTMDIIRMMQEAKKDDDRLTIRDVLGLIDRREGHGPQSLKEKWEEMMALRDMAAQIAGGGGGGEDNFWTAISRLLEQPDLAKGIGKALEKAGGRQPQPTIVSHQPTRLQQPAPAGQIPAQTQRQETVSEKRQEEAPKIPAGLRPKLEKIEQSLQIADEGESRKARVIATVEALVVLWNDPNWNKFAVELLAAVTQNDKEKALRGLGGFLGFMHKHGLLANEAGKAAFLDFSNNWDFLQPELTRMLGGFLKMAPRPTSEQATGVDPAEAGSGDEEDEDEEDEEDEESDEDESEDESEDEDEKSKEVAEVSPATPPAPLFITELPQDSIEDLYRQAQRSAI